MLENTKNNIIKKFIIFVIILIFIVILLIISLGLISWPVSDDYRCYVNRMELGFWGFVWDIYINWDGRFLYYLILSLFFGVFNLEYLFLIVTFNSFALIISAYLLLRLLNIIVDDKKNIFYGFGVILIALWLGLSPIIKEVVYWAGGVSYITTALLVLLWIYLNHILILKDINFKYKYLFFSIIIFSFFIGTVGQHLSPSLIFLLIIMLILGKGKLNKIFGTFSLFFLILGTIFMYLAPGNYIRSNFWPGSFNFSIYALAKNYIQILINYLEISRIAIILGIFISLAVVILKYKNFKFVNNFKDYLIKKKKNIILIFSYLIAALISIMPFTLVPGASANRASIFFIILIFIFVYCISFLVFEISIIKIKKKYLKVSLG